MTRLASRFGAANLIRRDVKLNRALWVMAETMLSGFQTNKY